jgi:hypothetical protein
LNGAVEYLGEGFRVMQGTHCGVVVIRHLGYFEFWVNGHLEGTKAVSFSSVDQAHSQCLWVGAQLTLRIYIYINFMFDFKTML